MSVKTCPKCGRLIAPQLARCRGCKTYLHGNRVEGWLMGAVPVPLRSAPATGFLFLSIAVSYLVLALLALPSTPLSFTSYTLQQAGAAGRFSLAFGEWWRLVTCLFIHHDVVHLAFNLYCLAIVGPIVERLFGRKKTFLLYLATGVGSMLASHLWYAGIVNTNYVSAGASGSVCGFIGLAWFGAMRSVPQESGIADAMKRWAGLLVIWGLLVPNINNAAHLGGFVAGVAFARVLPLGPPKTVSGQRRLSAVALVSLLGVIACALAMVSAATPHPWSLARDINGANLMGFSLSGDRPAPEDSTQQDALDQCGRSVMQGQAPEVVREHCEFAVIASPANPSPYHYTAQAERLLGNHRRAARLDHARELLRSLTQ